MAGLQRGQVQSFCWFLSWFVANGRFGSLGLEERLLMASSLSLSLSIHECLIEQSLNRSTILFARKILILVFLPIACPFWGCLGFLWQAGMNLVGHYPKIVWRNVFLTRRMRQTYCILSLGWSVTTTRSSSRKWVSHIYKLVFDLLVQQILLQGWVGAQ